MHTHAGGIHNHVTLTFKAVTYFISGLMHAYVLLENICVPNFVLIAQVVFLSQCGQHARRDTQSHRYH